MINNFGATTSLQNILNELEKAGTKIKRETLNSYIKILCDAKILYECNRFDLKSKKSIAGEKKYYLSDLGFYYATNTDNRINYGPVMENIAYVYARANNYSVSLGRIGKLEYKPLETIKDNYPKYVLTRNDPVQHRNGILHKNMPELMKNGDLF